jgi:hypothetical protein
MTDNITLRRAVGDEVRDLLCHADFTHFHFAAKRREMLLRAATALAALDAALAEPDAKRKPATMKQIITAHGTTIGAPWFEDFARAWKAAERFHGIRKEDKT